jgi:hypothetical protein
LKPTDRQDERNVEGVEGSQETPLLLGRRGGTGGKPSALKVSRQCPPVLVVKIGWEECKVLATEERNSMGNRVCLVM